MTRHRKPRTEEQKLRQREDSRAWRIAHPDLVAAQKKRYYSKHREGIIAKVKLWAAENHERKLAAVREWQQKNPDRVKASHKKYRAENQEKGLSTCRRNQVKRQLGSAAVAPNWRCSFQIELVYAKAKQLGLEVDHVVPVKHSLVCGLHVWPNLQLLTASLNKSKGNKHWPNMPSLEAV